MLGTQKWINLDRRKTNWSKMGLGNGRVETDLHEDVINIANYRIPIR